MKMATKQSNIPHTTSWTQSVSNSSCVKRKDAKDQSTQKITFSIYTVLAWYKLTKWPFNRGANNIQAIWYYVMVRFRTIDLKSHPIAQFEENRIIRKKMLNSSKENNEF